MGRRKNARNVRTIYTVENDYSALHRARTELAEIAPGVVGRDVVAQFVTDPYGPIETLMSEMREQETSGVPAKDLQELTRQKLAAQLPSWCNVYDGLMEEQIEIVEETL